MGWDTVLQDASYRDVPFEVVTLDESNGKDLARHERPFVQGVDLEDMGLSGSQLQVGAVFWGKGYAQRLKRLLEALEQPGGGVLVHPVWGRMSDMVAASWSYRHDAENVDHATVDITFHRSTEKQPGFALENRFLVELESLISDIDVYREAAFGFIDTILAAERGVSDLWGSTLGIWSAAAGTFAAVRGLFDLDKIGFPDRGGYSASGFRQDSQKLFIDLAEMVRIGIRREAGIGGFEVRRGGLSERQRFEAASALADKVCDYPAGLLVGRFSDGVQSRLNRITAKQIRPVAQSLRLVAVTALAEVSAELIEAHGEDMPAPDLMQVNRMMRSRVQNEIKDLRRVQELAFDSRSLNANAVYAASYQAAEALREAAGRLNALAVAAINQKPPLIVRHAPIDGTVHQIAYAFYGDIARASELERLNPHITHPAFIKRGTPVNSYAK